MEYLLTKMRVGLIFQRALSTTVRITQQMVLILDFPCTTKQQKDKVAGICNRIREEMPVQINTEGFRIFAS